MARARWIYDAPGFRSQLAGAGLADAWHLSDRGLGEVVTDHRSSWVRHAKIGTRDCYIKTYDYSSWRDRCRGSGRTTVLARSRPRRELEALSWLADHGFGGPEPLGAVEIRTLGYLRRALLVTAAWPGDAIDRLLPTLSAADRAALLSALGTFVQELHRAGFRDGNLDLRNILGRREQAQWQLVKIDSPKYRVVAPGRTDDRLANQDWSRLQRSLAEAGISDAAGSLRPR